MMDLKRSFRALMLLLLVSLLTIGLASCRLPASQGPQTESTTSEGFPVPGETEQTSGEIDLTQFATQTARVSLPVVVSPGETPQNTPQAYPSPVATSAPVVVEPTATELTYVQPTPGGPPETHILQEGEYPFCIARRFNVSQAELLQLNGITPDTLLSIGSELKIPQTGTPFEGERTLQEHPTTYGIKAGDTLGSIACYFGDVSPDMIALQNNLSTTDLPVGEVLIIP